MPRRRAAKPQDQSSGEWVKRTRGRVEDLPEGETFQRSLSPSGLWEKTGSDVKMQTSGATDAGGEEMQILEKFVKLWKAVMQKACTKLMSFEPSDYTTIVAGRPVQAVHS